MKNFDWTPERVETLRRLWTARQTGQEIAQFFGDGATRCGVIGKARRLGLEDRRKPPPSPHAEWHKSEIVTAVLTNRSSCAWPIGDPKQPEFHFCGQPTVRKKPYCEVHCAVSYGRRKDEPAAAE